MKVNVENCSSCGGTHTGMSFNLLPYPVPVGGENFEYTSTCPETGDAIFMSIVANEEKLE